MAEFAAAVAFLSAVAQPSASGACTVENASLSSRSTASMAMALAISPAAAPPIPSATMNSEPRSPTGCDRTSGWSVAFPRVRSATTKASSLCSRIRPTSVRPNTCTTTSPSGEGDGCDPAASGTLTRSVSFTGLEAFVELFPPSRSEIVALDATHERASPSRPGRQHRGFGLDKLGGRGVRGEGYRVFQYRHASHRINRGRRISDRFLERPKLDDVRLILRWSG